MPRVTGLRLSFDTYFINLAQVTATRGTCDRKQVGAVLVDAGNRIISTGYNGAPAGMPHCDDLHVGHELVEIDGRPSCIRALHAESNAIDYAAGKEMKGGTIYTTIIPCYECAKRIINAGIVRAVYLQYYESRNTKLVKDYFARSPSTLVQLL